MRSTLFILFLFIQIIATYAQILETEIYHYPQPPEIEPCYYSSYTLNARGKIENLQTESVMVEEWTTPKRGRLIDFTLLKSDNSLILLVEIHEDAEEKLQPICFGSKTKIQFELRDGSQVTLPQIGPKRCGFVNIANDETPYYNITNLGYFLISENAAKKLLNSETYLGKITTKNYELTFVFKSEIYDEVNDIMVYPELYFISELDCMLNPVLPKD